MTIPASEIVAIQPGVISGGGSPLSLNGVMITFSELIPAGTALSLSSSDAVSEYFGTGSIEHTLSINYFLGFSTSTIKPGALLFWNYVDTPRAAFLRSGSFSGVSLATLQGFSGIIALEVDGAFVISGPINLATATSFSNAATLIEAGFAGQVTCRWNSVNSTFTLTSSTTGSTSSITYATTGSFSTSLKFTSETGAVLSQGQDVMTVFESMTALKNTTQNWAAFMTVVSLDDIDSQKFAEWVNAQNLRFIYVCSDSNSQATIANSTNCFGFTVKQAGYECVELVYVPDETDLAAVAFSMGIKASTNYDSLNGALTQKFKSQSGIIPTVTDAQIARNLTANGYNYYGVWATGNDQFQGYAEGQISGKWKWVDEVTNEIYLNSQFQLYLMDFLFQINKIPYNDPGYALIRNAMLPAINQALLNGTIQRGVTLSESQKAIINQAVGVDVSNDIFNSGFFLLIRDPGSQTRALRQSPDIKFWYTSGGAVHNLTFPSINIQ